MRIDERFPRDLKRLFPERSDVRRYTCTSALMGEICGLRCGISVDGDLIARGRIVGHRIAVVRFDHVPPGVVNEFCGVDSHHP